MLEFLRKHQGTMWIVITVVIIISFVFFGDISGRPTTGQTGPQDTAFTIYGKDYSFSEFDALQRAGSVADQLQLTVTEQQIPFVQFVVGIDNAHQVPQGSLSPDFAFNLLTLRRALTKYGIRASDAEVQTAYANLSVLQGENGKLDIERARSFESNLGSYGFTRNHLYDILRDWIGAKKLLEVVAGNYVASDFFVDRSYAAAYQNIKASTIPFPLDNYRKDVKITDEEIQKYYDEQKDNFKTIEKRGIAYAFFPAPDTASLSPEDAIKKRNEDGVKVNNFSAAVLQADANFEELAKAAGVEVKNLAPFAFDSLPEEIKTEFPLLQAVFQSDPKVTPVSDAIKTAKGYYIFKFTDVVAPVQQELKEVKDSIVTTLTNQKASELMTQAANEARKKMEELIKGGKSFEDATKELKLTPQKLADFTPGSPPTDLSNGYEIADQAQQTAEGNFTEPLSSPTGIILLYVNSKQLYKREDIATVKSNVEKRVNLMNRISLFSGWFQKERADGKLDGRVLLQHLSRGEG